MSATIIRYRKARRRNRLQIPPHKKPRRAGLLIAALAGLSIGTLGISLLEPADKIAPQTLLNGGLTFSVAAHAVQVIDGDTIEIGSERFRLDGWDTPEKFGNEKCHEEKLLGERASKAAKRLFHKADTVTVVRRKTDRYGRTVSQWMVDGQEFGSLLHQQGLAKPWTYGHESKPDWCDTR